MRSRPRRYLQGLRNRRHSSDDGEKYFNMYSRMVCCLSLRVQSSTFYMNICRLIVILGNYILYYNLSVQKVI